MNFTRLSPYFRLRGSAPRSTCTRIGVSRVYTCFKSGGPVSKPSYWIGRRAMRRGTLMPRGASSPGSWPKPQVRLSGELGRAPPAYGKSGKVVMGGPRNATYSRGSLMSTTIMPSSSTCRLSSSSSERPGGRSEFTQHHHGAAGTDRPDPRLRRKTLAVRLALHVRNGIVVGRRELPLRQRNAFFELPRWHIP